MQGVAGTWKDLTDSVNSMATNNTEQLHDISKIATAIAIDDLTCFFFVLDFFDSYCLSLLGCVRGVFELGAYLSRDARYFRRERG